MNARYYEIHIKLARQNIAAQEAAGYDCASQRQVMMGWIEAAKNIGLCVACALMIAAGPILEAAGLLKG